MVACLSHLQLCRRRRAAGRLQARRRAVRGAVVRPRRLLPARWRCVVATEALPVQKNVRLQPAEEQMRPNRHGE